MTPTADAEPAAEAAPSTTLSFKFKDVTKKPMAATIAKHAEEETPDFVKGLSGSEIDSVVPKEKPKAKVIAPLANTWNPYGKRPAVAVAVTAAPTAIDVEAREAVLADMEALHAEQKEREGADPMNPALRKVDTDKFAEAKVTNDHDWTKNTGKGKSHRREDADDDDDVDEDEKVKRDIQSRPDQASLEEYEEMPIEDFGVGMLRSMGWDGGAIGDRNKGLVEPVMFVPRGQGYAGLGSNARPPSPKKKRFIKPGESRETKPVMVAPVGEDGKVRNYIGVSEKLVKAEAKQVAPGARVEVIAGKHKGVYAVVVKMSKGASADAIVAEVMLANGERLNVDRSELELVDRSRIKNDVLEKSPFGVTPQLPRAFREGLWEVLMFSRRWKTGQSRQSVGRKLQR